MALTGVFGKLPLTPVHVWPPLVVRKMWPVPNPDTAAHAWRQLDGSITMSVTNRLGSPVPAAPKVFPPSVETRTCGWFDPSPVVATYTTVGLPARLAAAMAISGVLNVVP